MKTILIFICPLFVLVACYNQNKIKSGKRGITYQISDSSLFDTSNISLGDGILKIYVDSIEKAKVAVDLPKFLANPQFDYQMAGFFSTVHHPISLRKLIIDKVKNCRGLSLIIGDSQDLYKKKPIIQHDIALEFADYSIYDLAVLQSRRLACM